MKQIPLLPIAPRPYDGELISSWQGRVACRYGCTADEIDHWLECGGEDGASSFSRRDFHPSALMLDTWVRSCRLGPGEIEVMVLGRLTRAVDWYVDDERERGICTECLDEDVSEGREHYLRRKWSHAEAGVCAKHRRTVQNFCERCFTRSRFRFDCRQGRAVLVCGACTSPVSTATRETEVPALLDFLIALSDAIEAMVEGRHALSTDDLTTTMKFLRMPTQSNAKPYIVWIRRAFGQPPVFSAFRSSLADLSGSWRIATLIAAAQLLDLVQARQLFGDLPTFVEHEFTNYQRGSSPSVAERPTSAAKGPASKLQLRSDEEYRHLAQQIVESREWNDVANMKGRMRDRHVWRLMNQALKSAPDQNAVPRPTMP